MILEMEPGQQIVREPADLFPAVSGLSPKGNSVIEGTLRIEVDAEGILGGVVFGDDATLEFAAAMPLQGQLFRVAVFSQVANVPGFFTGLALHFPEQAGVSITGSDSAD